MLKRILQAIINFFKKHFGPKPQPEGPSRRALLFAINDYPGEGNDLRGCINDQNHIKEVLQREFPKFNDIFTYRNEEVTVYAFLHALRREIVRLEPGDTLFVHYSGHGTYVPDRSGDEEDGYDEALFLYDGTLIDDDIRRELEDIPAGAIVVVMLDCCFAGTATKAITFDNKNKFIPPKEGPVPKGRVKQKFAKSNDMWWIAFGGSDSTQTSADAYIGGSYNGAFTYCAAKLLSYGITYYQWHRYTANALANYGFIQSPQIEGDEALLNNLVLYYDI